MVARSRRGERSWTDALGGAALGAWLMSGCVLESGGPVLFHTDAGAGDAGACSGERDPCAAQVRLSGQTVTSLAGGDGGSPYADLCPDEQILIGYAGTLREISVTSEDIEVIGSLEAVCGQLSHGRGAHVTVTPAPVLETRGEPRGAYGAWSRICPQDHALVGVRGRAGVALDQLAFVCARWQSVALDATLESVSELWLPSIGGSGGQVFELRCPSGQIARGHELRAGRWIDAFALICATPTLASDEMEP